MIQFESFFSNFNPFFDVLIRSEGSDVSQNGALAYGTTIFLMTIVPGIASSHSLFEAYRSGTKVRVAICSLIYQKVDHIITINTYHKCVYLHRNNLMFELLI